jgi:hypothetical protein
VVRPVGVRDSYQFNMTVQPGQTYYLYPTVATGYVFKAGAGDPNVASVLLPALQSAAFDLTYLLDGSLDTAPLLGGTPYTFLSKAASIRSPLPALTQNLGSIQRARYLSSPG